MKKMRFLSMLLISSMLMLTLAGTSFADDLPEEEREELELAFNDADEASWAVQAIGLMKSQEILSGYEDGNFRPNKPVSRVEAVVAAVRLMGLEGEAKAVPADSELTFADASEVNKKYKWAKGYIIVALEQGLFDTSETKLDPQKPASRVWVSALLVKALGLEDEALALMTDVPDFKDVSAIPAGSIGYVNIAVQEGIVTGYPDETFKPNKNVTRAELAALLVRTNDSLLEQEGAVTVSGEVTAISFEAEQEEAAPNEENPEGEEADEAQESEPAEEAPAAGGSAATEETAAADESAATEETATADESAATEEAPAIALGTITVESFNGGSITFKISAELPVTYEDQFIPASELVIGDYVSLTAEDGVVVNASFINEEDVNTVTAGLLELKLELEIDKDYSVKLEYENKKGEPEAKIEAESGDVKVKLSGDEAVQELETILEAAKLTPELSEEEAAEQLLAALEMPGTEYTSYKVELKFANGTKLEFESKLGEEDKPKGREDKEDRPGGGKKR